MVDLSLGCGTLGHTCSPMLSKQILLLFSGQLVHCFSLWAFQTQRVLDASISGLRRD